MRLRHVGILAAAVAGLVLSTSGVKAATIDLVVGGGSVTLQAILDAGSVQVGNLFFSSFGYVPPDVIPKASQIIVTAFTYDDETGLAFNSGLSWGAAPGQANDWGLTFIVTGLNGVLIHDDYLRVAGSAPGLTSWRVDEAVNVNGASLYIQDSSSNIIPDDPVIAYFAPSSSLTISKDINVNSYYDNRQSAQITTIWQGFSTTSVPVPAAAWMGFSTLAGLAGMGLVRRRRNA